MTNQIKPPRSSPLWEMMGIFDPFLFFFFFLIKKKSKTKLEVSPEVSYDNEDDDDDDNLPPSFVVGVDLISLFFSCLSMLFRC